MQEDQRPVEDGRRGVALMDRDQKTTYRTHEEIEEFKRLYPHHRVPFDAEAVEVTIIDGQPSIEVLRPNTASPGLVSPEGVNTGNSD
jgi:hypothetical protein